MEGGVKNLCCGCLSNDRKMKLLKEHLKYDGFSRIIGEIPLDLKETQLFWLCWECEAYIRKFIKFKQRVEISCQQLLEYSKQRTQHVTTSSPLTVVKITNINIINDTDGQEATHIDNLDTIKEENVENYTSDDDYSRNIRKKKKKKKKDSFTTRPVAEVCHNDLFKEVQLSQEEVHEDRRKMELADDFVNAMFRCTMCIISFPNEDDFTEHIEKKHELKSPKHKCDICQCCFNSEVSYNYHKNRHVKRYQCIVCQERCYSKRGAMKHYQQAHCHSETYELEQRIDKDNETTDGVGNDVTMSKDECHACEFCNKMFRWKTSLRKHIETHKIEAGQKRRPYCEPCGLSFTTTSNLQKHVKTSSKHQIRLKLRKLETNDEIARQQQIEDIKCSINTARELFQCPQCDRKFQWRGNMLRHLQTHAARANGELVCEPCNRKFSSIATYKQHMKISKRHATENDFKYMCSDCGKKFANKTKLKEHVDWEHLKNYVHTCSECQKVFKSHTSLYLHRQVVHKVSAEHLCDHCGKSFPNQTKLRSHITALHSGEAPYKCGSCAARFTWHSCLSRHVRRLHRQHT